MPPLFFFLPIVFWLALLGGGFYLAVRFLRAFERRNSGGAEIADVHSRMERLEDTLESMNKRIETIGQAQEFTTRLLTDRPGTPPGSGSPPPDGGQ